MYIGEECMVRYPEGDRFIWWNARIKSIQKHTVSVIWIEGEYRGTETPKVPHTELFLDETKSDMKIMKDDIRGIKETMATRPDPIKIFIPLLKGVLTKLDDLNNKLDEQTKFLFFNDNGNEDDVVSYDSSLNRLADSLRGLSSGSVEMDDIPSFSNRKKYASYEGDRKY